MLRQFLPIIVYGLFVYNGNVLNLSAMAMANMMMGRIQGNIHQVKRLYHEFFRIEESMHRLNSFYFAPEVQRGLINKKEASEKDEYALTVKGSFSWGITLMDKEQKDKLQEKAKKKEEKELEKT